MIDEYVILLILCIVVLIFIFGYIKGSKEPIYRGNERINMIKFRNGKFSVEKEDKVIFGDH